MSESPSPWEEGLDEGNIAVHRVSLPGAIAGTITPIVPLRNDWFKASMP